MGFTIDMVSGYVSDITNGADMGKIEESEPMMPIKIDAFESLLPQERLLPVAETCTQEHLPDAYSIPDSLIDCDIDLFIEKIAP